MRAVFIVIALRPSETNETSFQSSVQGPQLCLCVTHSFAESWESRKARKKKAREAEDREDSSDSLLSIYIYTHSTQQLAFKLSNCTWFDLFSPARPRTTAFGAQFYAALAFCILCVFAFYEPHVDRKQIQMAMGIAIAIANGKCRRTNRDLSRKPSLISARQSRQQFFFIASWAAPLPAI